MDAFLPPAARALTRDRVQLAVIDVQEAFRDRIAGFDDIARLGAFVVRVARALGVPHVACEQNPDRLGGTAPEVLAALEMEPAPKMSFDATANPGFRERLDPLRDQVVLMGVEAHVCVLQTALGLLRSGREVFLVLDAVGSQCATDRETAVRRALAAGAVPTSAEAVAFELLASAEEPRFREVLALILDEHRAAGRRA